MAFHHLTAILSPTWRAIQSSFSSARLNATLNSIVCFKPGNGRITRFWEDCVKCGHKMVMVAAMSSMAAVKHGCKVRQGRLPNH